MKVSFSFSPVKSRIRLSCQARQGITVRKIKKKKTEKKDLHFIFFPDSSPVTAFTSFLSHLPFSSITLFFFFSFSLRGNLEFLKLLMELRCVWFLRTFSPGSHLLVWRTNLFDFCEKFDYVSVRHSPFYGDGFRKARLRFYLFLSPFRFCCFCFYFFFCYGRCKR